MDPRGKIRNSTNVEMVPERDLGSFSRLRQAVPEERE
jgi:hypothetical protein